MSKKNQGMSKDPSGKSKTPILPYFLIVCLYHQKEIQKASIVLNDKETN
jgi:hypothetical protein